MAALMKSKLDPNPIKTAEHQSFSPRSTELHAARSRLHLYTRLKIGGPMVVTGINIPKMAITLEISSDGTICKKKSKKKIKLDHLLTKKFKLKCQK